MTTWNQTLDQLQLDDDPQRAEELRRKLFVCFVRKKIPDSDRALLVNKDKATILAFLESADDGELLNEVKRQRQETSKIAHDLSAFKRSVRSSQRSITTHTQAGDDLLHQATRDPLWKDFPTANLPMPEVINPAFKLAWTQSKEEKDLQPLAVKAVVALASALHTAGFQVDYHVLDTHKEKYYKFPTAKIDIAISATPSALWVSYLAALELKFDLNIATVYKQAAAQLLDRYEAMKASQPQRNKMLGIVWGKDNVEIWRFGSEEVVRSTLLNFEWDEHNLGYQKLVGFLKHTLLDFGYTPLAKPPEVRLGNTVFNNLELLAQHSERMVFTATSAQSAGQTFVIKLAAASLITREVELLQRCAGDRVVPELLHTGQLDRSVGGLEHCYVSQPFGRHLEDSMGAPVLLSAMKQLAGGLGRLHTKGVLHRDISPSNLVVVKEDGPRQEDVDEEPRLVLLDLHVARGASGGGVNEPEKITGKLPYLALRLMYADSGQQHSLATDLESTFFSFLDIASGGRALRWRHSLGELVRVVKFHTLYHPGEWDKAVSFCLMGCRQALRNLRTLFFGTTFEEYLARSVTPEQFVAALQ